MAAEHLRITSDGTIGLYQGYYCCKCGTGGLNMYGMGGPDHGMFTCYLEPNPTLVAELQEINKFGEEVVGFITQS